MIPARSDAGSLYLEPLGLLSPGDAGSLPTVPALGGTKLAAAVAVWRPDARPMREVVSAERLWHWLSERPAAVQQRLHSVLENWRSPPAFDGCPGSAAQRPALMGVVNCTSDSFFAESRATSHSDAVDRGLGLLADGAALIDVGGQSTRPRSAAVSVNRELDAVLPVVSALANRGATVSIDTVRQPVAIAAVQAGARMVNDVSGLLPAAAAGSTASLIVGHARGNPTTMQRWPRLRRGIFELYDWAERQVARLTAEGLPRHRIAIDPGFGFGTLVNHNHAILQRLSILSGVGVAIVLGVSRKASLGFWSGASQPADRLPASLAAALVASNAQVALLRVHDVAATQQALQISRLLR